MGTQGAQALAYCVETGRVVGRGSHAYEIIPSETPGCAEQWHKSSASSTMHVHHCTSKLYLPHQHCRLSCNTPTARTYAAPVRHTLHMATRCLHYCRGTTGWHYRVSSMVVLVVPDGEGAWCWVETGEPLTTAAASSNYLCSSVCQGQNLPDDREQEPQVPRASDSPCVVLLSWTTRERGGTLLIGAASNATSSGSSGRGGIMVYMWTAMQATGLASRSSLLGRLSYCVKLWGTSFCSCPFQCWPCTCARIAPSLHPSHTHAPYIATHMHVQDSHSLSRAVWALAP